MSLVLLGLCHGFHSNKREFNGNTFIDNQVLIEIEQTNRYGIAEVKTVAVKLSKAHIEQGIQHLWDQQKGKTVAVPVFVSPWASKAGNAGYDLILSGDGKPEQLQRVQPVKAAS
ncbi:hypothetical protein N7403_31945 [Pseudomonas nitroreducens]|uniref:DNA-binding protein n=1 Tax=Pseudomonas nitroreducens TaxID=46680 RepID=UPI0024492374|nr:DNA-binding protein [Pseudomonas nitroreducens]MDG9858487.1 hypothetical protein [Pseudomonas nitroreducens]